MSSGLLSPAAADDGRGWLALAALRSGRIRRRQLRTIRCVASAACPPSGHRRGGGLLRRAWPDATLFRVPEIAAELETELERRGCRLGRFGTIHLHAGIDDLVELRRPHRSRFPGRQARNGLRRRFRAGTYDDTERRESFREMDRAETTPTRRSCRASATYEIAGLGLWRHPRCGCLWWSWSKPIARVQAARLEPQDGWRPDRLGAASRCVGGMLAGRRRQHTGPRALCLAWIQPRTLPLSLPQEGDCRMNHDTYDNAYIAGILNSVKTIAMVGASANDVRPSYFVMKYLIGKGFTVFPINPGQAGKEILGRMIYARLADIPGPDRHGRHFSRPPAPCRASSTRCCALDPLPKVIWMQLDGAPRRGGRARRGRRHQGGHEPLPQDRIWQAVGRDRLDRRQFRRAVVEEAADAVGLPELRRASRSRRTKLFRAFAHFLARGGANPAPTGNFLLCIRARASPKMPGIFQQIQVGGIRCPSARPVSTRLPSMPAPSPIRRPARAPRRSTRRPPLSSTMSTMPRRCSG